MTDLDDQQLAAVECLSGPVVIYAGAGTGKTRTITHRIAHGVATGAFEPQQTLAVTFTKKAAGELRSRLGALGASGVQVRTFHSAALRQLRFFYPQFFSSDLPQLVTNKFRHVATAAAQVHATNSSDTIKDLMSEIEWAKVNMISPDVYRERAEKLGRTVSNSLTCDQVARVYSSYLEHMDALQLMDFEDVLLTMAALLHNVPSIAGAVQQQYRHFTVDEFQDVSPVQFALLEGWLGQNDDICVVGDPAQTIYSFAGATADYLTSFKRYFPDTREFTLNNSYRSTEQIVAVANAILEQDGTSPVRLQAMGQTGPEVMHNCYADDDTEATAVAAQVKLLINSGVAPGQIAVLFRVNSQSEAFEVAMADLKIPVILRGADRFFERVEVRNAVLHMRAALHQQTSAGLGEVVRDVLLQIGWQTDVPVGRSAQETWGALNTIVELADDFAAEHSEAGLLEFIGMLDQRSDQEYAPEINAVTLASIHSAKGLEWEAVFVIGLSEGLLPISHVQQASELQEERRLFYVAVTRAKQYLYLSWALAHRAGGQAQRRPSRFLSGLGLES